MLGMGKYHEFVRGTSSATHDSLTFRRKFICRPGFSTTSIDRFSDSSTLRSDRPRCGMEGWYQIFGLKVGHIFSAQTIDKTSKSPDHHSHQREREPCVADCAQFSGSVLPLSMIHGLYPP